jgi:hypothetical protein
MAEFGEYEFSHREIEGVFGVWSGIDDSAFDDAGDGVDACSEWSAIVECDEYLENKWYGESLHRGV